MVISESMTLPCTPDRVVLAVQDLIDQSDWRVLELTSARIVVRIPIAPHKPLTSHFTVTIKIAPANDAGETQVDVSVKTATGAAWKKDVLGIMGKVTNSLSLRVQAESISINPTVAMGNGQGTQSQQPLAGNRDRVSQLKDLKELLDSGVLSEGEFAAEKARILAEG